MILLINVKFDINYKNMIKDFSVYNILINFFHYKC